MWQAGDLDWDFFSDSVMGGVSEGSARLETAGGTTFIRLTGTVSTENRGGFLQVRTDLPGGLPPDAQGLRLIVRGNGARYFIHLRTTSTVLPWQYWQAGFDTGPDWQEVTLPLSAFKPSGRMLLRALRPAAVRSIGLVAFGRDYVADVALSRIGPY